MGTSTDAYLLYGYDLGGPEEWKIEDLGRRGEWEPDWLPPAEADDDPDFVGAVEQRLLDGAGFPETNDEAPGYYLRRSGALGRIVDELETHCHRDFPEYVLTAKQVTAYRGFPQTLDLGALEAERVTGDFDGKLGWALGALGIRPTQRKPEWLLCSYWG